MRFILCLHRFLLEVENMEFLPEFLFSDTT